MKKTLISVSLLLAVLLLCACSAEAKPDGSFKMTATVTALGEKLEVEVIEAEYAEGKYLVITSNESEFYDADGKEISLSDLTVGDKIEIRYGGQVMMSLPPQILAARITIL